jgi:hypothetical protein
MSTGMPHDPGPLKRVSGALAVMGLIRAVANRDIDAPVPGAVWTTPRSGALAKLALRLASDGREDAGAVQELVDAAGRHHKDLRVAAASIRSNGWVDESPRDNRANRRRRDHAHADVISDALRCCPALIVERITAVIHGN